MTEWKERYKTYFKNKRFLRSLSLGIGILFVSLVINYFTATYASERASNPVTDIILSNIRVYDVDVIFIFGPIILLFFVALVLFYQPRRIPFVLKSVALFIVIRSAFVSLTHLGPFPTHAILPPFDFLAMFTSGGDLFFSGHTGLPFLLALIYWNNARLRYTFLATSIVFAVVVLLGHLHYSIDVMSAFFITYTIFVMAQNFFRKDFELSEHGLVQTAPKT